MVRKRNDQRSTCPEGWLKAGIKVPVHLTVRQEKYAARCVGIARAVYNQMVATHRMARAHGGERWPSPLELEQTFNGLKHKPELGMGVRDRGEQVRGPGSVPGLQALLRELAQSRPPGNSSPSFKKKNRNGTGSFLAASGVDRMQYDGLRRIRLPYLGSVKLKRLLPDGIPYEVRIKKAGRSVVCQHQLLEAARCRRGQDPRLWRGGCGPEPAGGGQRVDVHYENPRALGQTSGETAPLAEGAVQAHDGFPGVA